MVFVLYLAQKPILKLLDCVGDWNGDPGSGWDVAGVIAATKDHTIVRKAFVTKEMETGEIQLDVLII